MRTLFLLLCLSPFWLTAQKPAETDYLDGIAHHDLSTIWMADSFLTDSDEPGFAKTAKPEPLGFIGDDYQRFYIHFLSAIRNAEDPYEYFVSGKTRVKKTVCNFLGTLKVVQAKLVAQEERPGVQEGYAVCELKFFEDPKQPYTGHFTGKLTTWFMIDEKRRFRYDVVTLFGDGFSNNEAVTTWTSYAKKGTKKCHWGDFRIPESGDLDTGAGEFHVDDKYVKNGWESYRKAFASDPETPEAKKAQAAEKAAWWK